jgi:hypothetical protein
LNGSLTTRGTARHSNDQKELHTNEENTMGKNVWRISFVISHLSSGKCIGTLSFEKKTTPSFP